MKLGWVQFNNSGACVIRKNNGTFFSSNRVNSYIV